MKSESHDSVVRKLAEFLKENLEAVTLYVDHVQVDGASAAKSLEKNEKALVAALVPGSSYFSSRFASISRDSVFWCVPDILIEHNGWHYVVEVCGNDSGPRAARKIENVVASADALQISGLAIVHVEASDGTDAKYSVEQTALFGRTINLLCGETSAGNDADWLFHFKRLLALPQFESVYGKVEWDARFRELWNNTELGQNLLEHVNVCLLRQQGKLATTSNPH